MVTVTAGGALVLSRSFATSGGLLKEVVKGVRLCLGVHGLSKVLMFPMHANLKSEQVL